MPSITPDEQKLSLPVRGRQLAAILFGVLVTVSIIGPGVIMLPGVQQDHDGTAAAQTDTSGDTLFTAAGGGYEALDSGDGTEHWRSTSSSPRRITQGPDGTYIYIASTTAVKQAYAANGSVTWSRSLSFQANALETNPTGDRLYVATNSDGTSGTGLLALDSSDGSIIWQNNSYPYRSLSVGKDGDYIATGTDNTAGVRLYNPDGTEVWSNSMPSSVDAVEIGPKTEYVYAGVDDNSTRRIEISTGVQEWSVEPNTGEMQDLAVAGSGEFLMTASKDNTIRRLDTADGSQLDSWDIGETQQTVSLSLDDEYFYHGGAGSNTLYKRQVSDGSEVWSNTYSSNVDDTYVSGSQGATNPDISGYVYDQNGDPVENATVYTAEWSTADPPQITSNRDLREIQQHPFPAGWDQQLDTPGVDKQRIDPSQPEWSETRVLMHTAEQWELQGPNMGRSLWEYVLMEDNEPRSEVVNPEVELSNPRTTISPEDSAVLTCWQFDESVTDLLSRPDPIDEDVPGAETTPCSITIEKVDPIGGTISTRTEESHPFVKYDSRLYEVGVSDKTHEAVAWRPSEGVYKMYPEGKPENAMYYVVAPDADADKHEAKIANVASSKEQAISTFNEKMQEKYDAGNLDIASTTTNESGYYELYVASPVNETDVIAVKPGGTRDEQRSNLSSITKQNFRAEAPTADGLKSDVWTQPEFEEYCQDMDTVMAETEVPYEGHERDVTPPDTSVDIHGVRAVPQDMDGEVSECFILNTVQAILDDGLIGLVPGYQDDLSALSRAELEARYSELMAFIEGTPALEDALDEQTSGEIDTILNDDPNELSRDTLESRLAEGMTVVDSGGLQSGGGGGGGVVGGGTSSPTVSVPESSTGNETLDAVWQVGGVTDWSDADILVRLHYSNGSTTFLNGSSEYVSVDETAVGSDTVRLEEYPLGATDPATVRVELDVATPDGSTGDPDTDDSVVRNPTFDGEIPTLRDMRVSKLAPGPNDNVSVSVTPREASRFGSLKYANVSHPQCSYGVTPTGGELDLWTCGEGDHHVSVTFTNPGGTEFTETFTLPANSVAQSRPATVRSKVGAVGRYAIANGQLRGGAIETYDGASVVEVIAIAEPGNVPNSVTASTTGMDVAKDSDTTVRVVEGDAQQTVRKRIGVVLHRDSPSDEALLYRNGQPVPKDGEVSSARINTSSGRLTMDTFTDETGAVTLRVNGDPGYLERLRHWVSLNVPVLSLSFGGDLLLFVTPLVLIARRKRRPPNSGQGGEQAA